VGNPRTEGMRTPRCRFGNIASPRSRPRGRTPWGSTVDAVGKVGRPCRNRDRIPLHWREGLREGVENTLEFQLHQSIGPAKVWGIEGVARIHIRARSARGLYPHSVRSHFRRRRTASCAPHPDMNPGHPLLGTPRRHSAITPHFWEFLFGRHALFGLLPKPDLDSRPGRYRKSSFPPRSTAGMTLLGSRLPIHLAVSKKAIWAIRPFDRAVLST